MHAVEFRVLRMAKARNASSALHVVQNAVQTGEFAPVYYMYGEDDFLKERAVDDILAAAVDESTREFNCEIRRGGELDAQTLGSILATPPMFADRRAVVIRDVSSLRKAARKELDLYLTLPAADTLLLMVSSAGSKVDAGLSGKSEALEFAPLSPDRVRKWIAHHAATELHTTISADAARLLQQAVGSDLQTLAGELDKCASYSLGSRGVLKDNEDDEPISVDVVSAVVGVRRGETVSDLLDAVAQRDTSAALDLVGHVLSQPKVTAVGIVMNLSAQQFALSYGRARLDSGVPKGRLQGEFVTFQRTAKVFSGRSWSEAASAWASVIDKWSAEDCERSLTFLLEADMALKETSVSNPEQIICSLVLGICAIGATLPSSRKSRSRSNRVATTIVSVALLTFALSAAASTLRAQVALPTSSASVVAVSLVVPGSIVDIRASVATARNRINVGEGPSARLQLDSLVDAQRYGSDELAEALYWRAVLSENVGDAERDWQRIAIETSLSPRVPDALAWLGELELVRGHAKVARGYLEQLLRDFSDAPQRSRAMLWIARSYFDEQNFVRACTEVATLVRSGIPAGEQALQVEEMKVRCATRAVSSTAPASRRANETPGNSRFSVQLAAYDTRAQAQTAVRKFASRGITARIDGTRKPFRLRTGSYSDRSAADAALAVLKKRGITGFVAEISK